jgi:hypothetical protein
MTGESIDSTPALHWQYFEFGYGPSPYVSPPTVAITYPDELYAFVAGSGEDPYFIADARDPVDGLLPPSAYRWTLDGRRLARRGFALDVSENTIGVHTITVTVRNGDGRSASDTLHFRVKAPPTPGAPIVRITTPADGASYCTNAEDAGGEYIALQMGATATDPSTPPGPLTYAWTDSIDGGGRVSVATSLAPVLKLYLRAGQRTTSHDLQLTATNGTGSTAEDVRVYIRDPLQCLG